MSERPQSRADDALSDEEVEQLRETLGELEAAADSTEERRVLRRTRSVLGRLGGGRQFGVDDLAQQVVGGFILSAPFVVTEEVWSLAASMNGLQWTTTVLIVFAIGYGTLYRADQERDAEEEESIGGLPQRFVSLLVVAYVSVLVLALVFDAPDTFGATPLTTVKAICIGAVFSVVGAATADSLF